MSRASSASRSTPVPQEPNTTSPADGEGPYDPVRLVGLPPVLPGRLCENALSTGQVANRYRFHAQQAFFFAPGHDDSEMDRLAEELVSVAGALASSTARPGAEEGLRVQFQEIRAWLSSEDHAAQLLAEEDALLGDCTDRVLVRGGLLAPLFAVIDRIRSDLLAEMDGESQAAFGLGEVIDGGLATSDVYRHLDVPSTAWDEADLPGQDVWAEGGQEAEPPRPRLASRRRVPGDVPCRPTWPREVEAAWAKAVLALPVPQPPDDLGRRERLDHVRTLVRTAQRAIRLKCTASRPVRTLDERLRIDRPARAVFLDGRQLGVVKHPEAFAVFCVIADGKGQRVVKDSVVACLRGTVYSARPDRVLGMLPAQIKVLVCGLEGAEGGYTLILPPE